jgi:TatD DNase family protein
MTLIDTHTHLYSSKFDSDRDQMINRAIDAGVDKFFLPNIDGSSIEGMLALESTYPDRCFPMMGLHPCSVNERYREELGLVKSWLDKRPFSAVGEIGLDLYWDKTYIEEQKTAFRLQMEWAKDLEIPIVIHTREAMDLAIDMVAEAKDSRLQGIFHCFTGNLEQARRIIDLDFYLGLGGVLTFKNGGVDKVVEDASIPMEKLVLETDAPYLAPTPKRGKRNESAYIQLVAEKLATVKQLSYEEVCRRTTENAEQIFHKALIAKQDAGNTGA